MRITLSTPRRLARARATRRLRSSRIGAGAGHAMADPTAAARMGNQITNPTVGAMVVVQVAAEAANNASIGLVTELARTQRLAQQQQLRRT